MLGTSFKGNICLNILKSFEIHSEKNSQRQLIPALCGQKHTERKPYSLIMVLVYISLANTHKHSSFIAMLKFFLPLKC